jgi:inorganic phosphate transporter, PiT family
VSSAAVSLGHGTNDAQKAMGVIAALLVASGHCRPIVQTMGQRITELRPARGMAAETGAAVALFGSTALGAPVSTTHTVAGAVTGVGAVTKGAPVNWSVFGQMAVAW